MYQDENFQAVGTLKLRRITYKFDGNGTNI